jgi:hypothetical protein
VHEETLKKKGKYLEKPKPRGIGARRSPKDGACLEYMTLSARSVTVNPVTVTPSARDVTLAVTLTHNYDFWVIQRKTQVLLKQRDSNCPRKKY